MICLVPLFILIITYMAGELITWILKDKKRNICEKCLIGTFFIFVIWELFTVVAIKIKLEFKLVAYFYTAFLLAIVVLAAFVSIKKLVAGNFLNNPIDKWIVAFVLATIVLEVICIIFVVPDNTGDYTVETVNTTLSTNTIYNYNPMTGARFANEMTFRGKLVSLPLFYAYLAYLFSGNVPFLVYKCITVWGILLKTMCFFLWGKTLFGKSEQRDRQIAFFVVGLGILNLCGLFSVKSIFYYQIFRGFRGEAICHGILIPYCLYAYYMVVTEKQVKNIAYLIMAVAATIAMVDIQKGLMPCLFSLIICLLITGGYRFRRWIKCRRL